MMECCCYFSTIILILASVSDGARYSIVDTTVGGVLAAKRIQNDDTGEYVETIVDYGGRVEDLVLNSRSTGVQRKVLLTHRDNATAVLENKWWKGMLLLPWANRIACGKYEFFNGSYQLPLNENPTDPPRHNALHGLMHGKKLRVTGTQITTSHATLQLSYHSYHIFQGWCFACSLPLIFASISEK